jgi:hypothetical protein
MCEQTNDIWYLELKISYTKARKKSEKKAWGITDWRELRCIRNDKALMEQLVYRYDLQKSTDIVILAVTKSVNLGKRVTY